MNYLAMMQISMRRIGLFAVFIILFFLSLYQYLRFDKTKSILLSIIEKQKDEFHRQIVKRESAYYAMKEIKRIGLSSSSIDSYICKYCRSNPSKLPSRSFLLSICRLNSLDCHT